MIKLKVLTPDKVLIDELVDNISIPTEIGMITVLDKHIPIISTIRAGELTIRRAGGGINFAVFKGLVNVRPHTKGLTEVVVLLERGEKVEEIDAERAKQALLRAKEIAEEKEDDIDFELYNGVIQKELNRIKIAMKYKK